MTLALITGVMFILSKTKQNKTNQQRGLQQNLEQIEFQMKIVIS